MGNGLKTQAIRIGGSGGRPEFTKKIITRNGRHRAKRSKENSCWQQEQSATRTFATPLSLHLTDIRPPGPTPRQRSAIPHPNCYSAAAPPLPRQRSAIPCPHCHSLAAPPSPALAPPSPATVSQPTPRRSLPRQPRPRPRQRSAMPRPDCHSPPPRPAWSRPPPVSARGGGEGAGPGPPVI